MSSILGREEYIEQAYFFRVLRERLADNQPTQQVLSHIHEELLSTTHMPHAVQFLEGELRHTGELSSGFLRLQHYFTPFQAYVIRQTEEEKLRFSIETALLVLEREATYRADSPLPTALFVYQFETLSRNRLGYHDGLKAMQSDPVYNDDWRTYLQTVQQQMGVVDFADLVYLRSEFAVMEQRRANPDFIPRLTPLFGEKEGKIAKANRGRDPLYLFAALQRQLGYPEVPRPTEPDNTEAKLELIRAKLREVEQRVKLVESEVRGHVDLSQFMVKPESFRDQDEE
ncbi:MAG: hypothetical protein ACFCD0_13650 [Gemmataceae bacterium]